MVCLGLEPGRQDGRRRRIHWAMMARLYFSKFIDWHVRYLHKSADGKGESENDCSDFVIGACLEEITKRASINSSWLKRHYIFLLFLLCSFIFCYLHSYFGQMYCPSLRIEPWRSCLKSKSALLISNPLGGLFERPPPPTLLKLYPKHVRLENLAAGSFNVHIIYTTHVQVVLMCLQVARIRTRDLLNMSLLTKPLNKVFRNCN